MAPSLVDGAVIRRASIRYSASSPPAKSQQVTAATIALTSSSPNCSFPSSSSGGNWTALSGGKEVFLSSALGSSGDLQAFCGEKLAIVNQNEKTVYATVVGWLEGEDAKGLRVSEKTWQSLEEAEEGDWFFLDADMQAEALIMAGRMNVVSALTSVGKSSTTLRTSSTLKSSAAKMTTSSSTKYSFPVTTGSSTSAKASSTSIKVTSASTKPSSTTAASTKTSTTSQSSSTTSKTPTSMKPSTMTSTTSPSTTSVSTTSTASTTSTNPSSTPSPEVYKGGYATYFLQGGVAGACGTVHKDSDRVVALDYRRYGDVDAVSPDCGRVVSITRVSTGKTINATVADACPSCENENCLDLSVGAFTQIATKREGEVEIVWSYLD